MDMKSSKKFSIKKGKCKMNEYIITYGVGETSAKMTAHLCEFGDVIDFMSKRFPVCVSDLNDSMTLYDFQRVPVLYFDSVEGRRLMEDDVLAATDDKLERIVSIMRV